MNFPAALPHDPIAAFGDGLYCVRGCIDLNRMLRISRNMTVVKQGDALTLVNAVRMNEAGLKSLDALGRVAHVMRIGAAHGRDDPFYVDRYKARFWGFPGGARYREPVIDAPLSDLGPLPFEGAKLLAFKTSKVAEAALWIGRGAGALVSCDALQHYGDYSNNNLPARVVMPLIGFARRTLVGPLWLKAATPEGQSLKGDFERLLELEFDAFVGAHGTVLARSAKASVREAVRLAFPG